MHNKIVTRIIAIAASAMMAFGTFTVGVMTPASVVEAADAATTKAIKSEFNAAFYATKYPDVKNVIGTNPDALYKHFVNFGMKEGRMLNQNFDPKAYIEAYPDIKAYCAGDYTKAYAHYVNNGKKEGRNLTTYEAINAKKAKEAAAAQAAAQAAAEAEKARQKQLEAQKKKEQEDRERKEREKNQSQNKTTNNTTNHTYITVINETHSVNIGHGLVLTLSSDQYNYSDITVLSNNNGYGAYIGNTCYATTYGYSEDDSFPYSIVTIRDGNVSENVFEQKFEKYYDKILDNEPEDKKDAFYDDDDDEEDALLLAALMAELQAEANANAAKNAETNAEDNG